VRLISSSDFGSCENAVTGSAAQRQIEITDLTFMKALMLSSRREWPGCVEN
jgi:hypothetical protein